MKKNMLFTVTDIIAVLATSCGEECDIKARPTEKSQSASLNVFTSLATERDCCCMWKGYGLVELL